MSKSTDNVQTALAVLSLNNIALLSTASSSQTSLVERRYCMNTNDLFKVSSLQSAIAGVKYSKGSPAFSLMFDERDQDELNALTQEYRHIFSLDVIRIPYVVLENILHIIELMRSKDYQFANTPEQMESLIRYLGDTMTHESNQSDMEAVLAIDEFTHRQFDEPTKLWLDLVQSNRLVWSDQ